ncbi:hypothetical protein FB565_003234 [Actinoplanes lutulentus]|uniref:Uncharacterized protein n=1 Tax=Actinoplanes lutulentus TaxID=1287878 RepID=A0A327ZJM8_9ACTN|nr:hypothetical protein [Actinoplanes lutulentus]MBB2943521.1 hypothetical protein [Actinoplanes lutulentus]RAK42186.1 hypothetical protein B0I29_1027 [Actinoplanes lutulentus]
MTEASAMSMFAALLDRSFVQIRDSAADGRFFDREKVIQVADVWDNNTYPLFGVALCRPGWVRERRARAALRWMAELGSQRRAWMIEQAGAAGYGLEPLLGPPVPETVHHRDSLGRVWPGAVPVTEAVAASIADDYDLTRAKVRTVRVERAGRELSGYLALTARRRYASPPDQTDAVVQVMLDDVWDVRFDSGDGAGATLTTGADGVEVRIGAQGHLRAASAVVTFDDPSWHLSRRGRAADADTPNRSTTTRRPRERTRPKPRGAASDAAFVLHQAMLEIRSVRYAKLAGSAPLRELCHAFADAGDGILAAAAQPRSERDHAFRQLAEKWIGASPELARRIARWLPDGHWLHQLSRTGPHRPAAAGIPTQAQLTLAGYTAAHTLYGTPHDAAAVINLAAPDDDNGWTLQSLEFPRPTRLTLDAAAFTAPDTVSGTPDMSLILGSGALTVICHKLAPRHHDTEAP